MCLQYTVCTKLRKKWKCPRLDDSSATCNVFKNIPADTAQSTHTEKINGTHMRATETEPKPWSNNSRKKYIERRRETRKKNGTKVSFSSFIFVNFWRFFVCASIQMLMVFGMYLMCTSFRRKKYPFFCNRYYEYVWRKNWAHIAYYYASQVFGVQRIFLITLPTLFFYSFFSLSRLLLLLAGAILFHYVCYIFFDFFPVLIYLFILSLSFFL